MIVRLHSRALAIITSPIRDIICHASFMLLNVAWPPVLIVRLVSLVSPLPNDDDDAFADADVADAFGDNGLDDESSVDNA
jgi:hypothetical protein